MKLILLIYSSLQLLLLSSTTFAKESPDFRIETSGNSVEEEPRNSFMSRVNDGLKPILRALEGVDSVLRSTRNFDVFQCLERFSCEMTAPFRDQESNRPFNLKEIEKIARKVNEQFENPSADEAVAADAATHAVADAGHEVAQQVVDPQLAHLSPQLLQHPGIQYAQPGFPYAQAPIQQFIQPFAYPSPYYHPSQFSPYVQQSPYVQPQQLAQSQVQYVPQVAHQPIHRGQAASHAQVAHQPNLRGQATAHSQVAQHQPTAPHFGAIRRGTHPGSIQRHHAPPPVKRSGTDFEHAREEQEPSSWFSGYRNRITKRQRQNRGNWFQRMVGIRTKRSTSNEESFLQVKSRVRRGIFDTIANALSGKEVVGVLDRMMDGTDDSLYPYTRAALMGYMGSHQTCEQLYPQCPTNTDELIDTFNNLRSHFPNGVPFKDRMPAPLRFLLP